jgi:hypothetical protein
MTTMAHSRPQAALAAAPAPRAGATGTLIETTERLADVLQRETSLLRAMKLSEAASVQLEKATLAEIYERCIRELQAQNGTLVTALPDPQRAALRKAGERLASATVDNERALRAARSVNERVLAAIVDAAREQRSPSHAYGTRGFSGGGSGALSLTVDRQL